MAILWDIVKMFDRVPHGVVARRAAEIGCPRPFVRAALAGYRLPRAIKWQSACSTFVAARRARPHRMRGGG